MKPIVVIFCFFTICTQAVHPQQAVRDSSLFDFWIGEWDLWWYGKDSVKEFGTNSIGRILDNTVIQERFEIHSGVNKGFKGMSISILDSRTKRWQQTWADNSGNYMPFTGGRDGTTRFFEREFTNNGKTVRQKMIFRSITRSSLVWDWMNSTDGGTTWKTVWSINYQRKR